MLMKIVKTAESANVFQYSYSQDPSTPGEPGSDLYPTIAYTISSSDAAFSHLGSPQEFFEFWKSNVGDIGENAQGAIDVNVAVSELQQTTGTTYIVH